MKSCKECVLWVFNKDVCIHTDLTENRPLEHVASDFPYDSEVKELTFNQHSVTILHPQTCQNPKLFVTGFLSDLCQFFIIDSWNRKWNHQ